MMEEVSLWLIEELTSWRYTFDNADEETQGIEETPELDNIIDVLSDNRELNKKEIEEVVFHLWQINYGREE